MLSCDNLNHNGAVLARLVQDFCAALPSAEATPLAGWIAEQVSFPSSMVDRIVPATTDADRAEARAISGLDDLGLVVAEPFRQWVIEDRFAGPRPAWELAGAQLTEDVTPYELMKLRLLNGSHSTLAYLGALRGHRTISDAVVDPALREIAERLIPDDMIPTVPPPDGVDLVAYGNRCCTATRTPTCGTPACRSPWTARRSCRSDWSPRRWRRSVWAGSRT